MESMELMPMRVRIAAILKKAILAGEYAGGQELSLVEVSQKLGVSRTPVREAFQTLAAEGFLELRMNKGAIVKPIDEKFIRDHYETRILLECAAVERATRNGMEVEQLLAQLQRLSEQPEHMDRQTYILLNQKIHTGIWNAADNRKLYALLQELWNGPSVGQFNSEQEHFQKSTQEHIQILQGIRDHQPEQACKTMERHIARSMENILLSFRQTDRIISKED